MIARFSGPRNISPLVIGAILVFQSFGWCQSRNTVDAGPPIPCSAPTTESGVTHDEVGKAAPQGTRKTDAKAESDSASNCLDGKNPAQPSAPHSQNLRSKGGGGIIALSTFLALVGLWCLIAVWAPRKQSSV